MKLPRADMQKVPDHQQELLIAFEGGSVHTAERDGQYFLLIDQAALLDMLDAEDRKGIEAVSEIAFASAAERDAYILERGWGAET